MSPDVTRSLMTTEKNTTNPHVPRTDEKAPLTHDVTAFQKLFFSAGATRGSSALPAR